MIRRVLLMAMLLMVSLLSAQAQSFKPILVAMPEEGTIVGYFGQEWQLVDKTAQHSFYRKLIKVEEDGYILQDFYSVNNAKQTDPFKVYDEAQFGASKIGLREGSMTLWSSEGQKLEHAEYKNGMVDGEYRTWHRRSGELKTLGYFKEGKPDALWTFWDENGNKQQESQYMNGEKVAQWRF